MDFLTIGNVTRDIIPGGYTVGGTVTYASAAALRLGRRPGVLTRLGPDIDLPDLYGDVRLFPLPWHCTLTFENIYTEDGRVQYVHEVGGPIGIQDIPLALREHNPPIVLLGPLAGELDHKVAQLFPNSLLGMVPQGWMRHWDATGRVSHNPIDCADEILRHADVLVVSTEDVAHDLSLAQCYSEQVPILVLTRGAHGCDVYHKGHITHVRPRKTEEVDPTGAGDTFTAAFLIRYAETGDPIDAARFANVAASMSVEGLSYQAMPTRAQIEAYLAQHNGGPRAYRQAGQKWHQLTQSS
jgi:hypothetical protein